MKVSLNWVRKYTDIDIPADKLIEKIGAQLGAVDDVVDLGAKYKGVLVARVVKSEKHPNADKLKVCLIDDGKKAKNVQRDKDGYVQVVCGAPNVAAGQLVAWMPPGVTVPSTYDKDPFVLEARELRGVVSNGMIGSAKELDIGDDHEGILVIDSDAKPGEAFADIYELDDLIIDIENKMFTHRPDCFGMLGIAREIAGIQHKPFKSPDWYASDIKISSGSGLQIKVKNEIPKLVPRFTAAALSNVKVKKSPVALQSLLSRVGIRPINNVVDLTNFYMLATGQPVHAYDWDKLKTGTLGVRFSKKGEELEVIGGKKIKLEDGAVVITDGAKPIGLGGVMGGAGTQVDETTRNIVIEVATFDMNLTRKTAMTYGLFTDAATRFTKGQSPLQNMAVLSQIAANIESLTGGKIASAAVDDYPKKSGPAGVSVEIDFINSRLGTELNSAQVAKLLKNVEFGVSAQGGKLKVTAPFWRTDIGIPEDIVEEVGRLSGYDNLKLELPKKDLTPAEIDQAAAFKSRLRGIMAEAGANELLTYSFVHSSLIEKAGQDTKDAYHIRNALSPDLQHYRMSLVPSLLEKVHPNVKSGYDEFVLYEIGKAHIKDCLDEEKLPEEFERLAIIYSSSAKNKQGAAFFGAKDYCNFLLEYKLSLALRYEPLAKAKPLPKQWAVAAKVFEPARSAVIYQDDDIIGLIGEPTAAAAAGLKLPDRTAQVEIDLAMLARYAMPQSAYYPLNKYPSLDQDICLRSKAQISYGELEEVIAAFLDEASSKEGYIIELHPLDIFQREGEKHRQTTWRITLSHPDRTLTTEESNRLLDGLAATAKQKLDTERV